MGWLDWAVNKGADWLSNGRRGPGVTSDPYGAGAGIFTGQGMGMQPRAPTAGPAFQPGGSGYDFLNAATMGEPGGSYTQAQKPGDPYDGIETPKGEPGMTSFDKWMLGLQGGSLLANIIGGAAAGRQEQQRINMDREDREEARQARERRRAALESSAPSVLGSIMNKRY